MALVIEQMLEDLDIEQLLTLLGDSEYLCLECGYMGDNVDKYDACQSCDELYIPKAGEIEACPKCGEEGYSSRCPNCKSIDYFGSPSGFGEDDLINFIENRDLLK